MYNLSSTGEPSLRSIRDSADEEDDQLSGDDPRDVETPTLRKASQHGLGHLLNPSDPGAEARDWINQTWLHVIRTDALSLPATEPAWLDQPALTRITISSPPLLKPFAALNRQQSTDTQVRPFNFLLIAHVAKLGHPAGADPERFLLVAPYNPDPRQWRKMRWTDRYTGKRYGITSTGTPSETVARVKTYRDVLSDYLAHPEHKSLGPAGEPCGPATRGLLQRRPVTAYAITYIGKEGNKLEDRQAGTARIEAEYLTEYANRDRDPFQHLVVPVLRELPVADIVAKTSLSERTIKAHRAGTTTPHQATRAALTAVAAAHARERLTQAASTRRATTSRRSLLT